VYKARIGERMDPKLLTEAGALAFLNTEPGKKLVSPLAEQLGLSLGDVGEIYRFYQSEFLAKIFTKWAAARGSKPPLSEEDLLKAMPLLQLASVQSNEELQAKWAALLESTVTTTDAVLPSFGQTLSQLSAEEAKFLDRLFALVTQPTGYLSEHRLGRDPFDYATLVRVYDPRLTAMNPAEREIFKEAMSKEQLENYDKLTQAELLIQDLERLGIISREQRAEPDRSIDFGAIKVPVMHSQTILRTEYSFTQYGVSFVRAVTPREVGK
jgi:abortive infection alpha-like protein